MNWCNKTIIDCTYYALQTSERPRHNTAMYYCYYFEYALIYYEPKSVLIMNQLDKLARYFSAPVQTKNVGGPTNFG